MNEKSLMLPLASSTTNKELLYKNKLGLKLYQYRGKAEGRLSTVIINIFLPVLPQLNKDQIVYS